MYLTVLRNVTYYPVPGIVTLTDTEPRQYVYDATLRARALEIHGK